MIKNSNEMKKVVVKISSNLLNPDLEIDIIEKLTKEISLLVKKGFQVIIVTSGAVMYGMKTMKYDKKPEFLPLLQSTAAIGQVRLMTKYQSVMEKYNLISAQILVSVDDFKVRKRYLNLKNTLESLLNIGAIPIFNENDSINTEELKFGDNDILSALITIMMDFDFLVLLTDVEGVFDKDPSVDKDANLIKEINDLDERHLENASTRVSKYSSGGMKRKLEAALKAAEAGINIFVGNGLKTSLTKIIEKKEHGTYIKANDKFFNARKKWLGFSPTDKGDVKIDEGAYKALKSNSSLLASGITGVEGHFSRGNLINIVYNNKKMAQGLTNYSSKEIELIKGKKSSEFGHYLKNCDYKEIIHKNNLYLIESK